MFQVLGVQLHRDMMWLQLHTDYLEDFKRIFVYLLVCGDGRDASLAFGLIFSFTRPFRDVPWCLLGK